jgi:hypothetical protein
MIALMLPGPAQAGEGSDAVIRLRAVATVGPIGRVVRLNEAGLMINGRGAAPEQLVWSGDLLQAQGRAITQVVLDGLGQVRMRRGSIVRLSTSSSVVRDGQSVLIGSLVSGDIDVALESGIAAFFIAQGKSLSATGGAAFRVGVGVSEPLVVIRTGEVTVESASQKYTIEPVGHGSSINVRAGDLRHLRLQVTDDGQPVPDVAVLFTLGDARGRSVGTLGMGTLAATVFQATTDAKGIATVPFVAGRNSGTAPVTATVVGTAATWAGQITVTPEMWNGRNKSLAIAAAAAAIAAAGVAIAKLNDKDPLRLEPPEVKKP